MTYPAALLVHQANLETGETLGAEDTYGIKTPTKATTTITCRFGKQKSSIPADDSGPHVLRAVSCIAPVGTVAKVGAKITGLTAPYNRLYRIVAVDPAMIAASVSHLVLTLEAIDG